MTKGIAYKDFNDLSEDEKRVAYEHFLYTKERERSKNISYLQKLLKSYDEINFVIHDLSDTCTTLSIFVAASLGYEGEAVEIFNLTEAIASVMGYEMCDTKNGRLTAKCKVNDTSHTLMSTIDHDLYALLFNKPGHFFGNSKL